jgi:hypothetical protein
MVTGNHGFQEAKSNLNKTEEKALEEILKLQNEIKSKEKDILDILKKNDLNLLDIEQYEHKKNVDKLLNIKLP